jgi:hypothetical protein
MTQSQNIHFKDTLEKKKPSSKKAFYMNKRGKRVNVGYTTHAKDRFKERWNLAFPSSKIAPSKVEETIIHWFNNSSLVKNFCKKEKQRIKKYKNTLFFRCNCFTFVVQNATIITIELSDRGCRHLNKSPIFLEYIDSIKPKKEKVEDIVVDIKQIEDLIDIQKKALEKEGYRCMGGNPARILYFNKEEVIYKLWNQNGVIKFCCTGEDE